MNILVTGGSKGIGYAIAECFLRRYPDSNIAICARNKKEIDRAVESLKKISSISKVVGGICDVAFESSVDAFVSSVESEFGYVDVLVNNSGFGIFKPVEELSEQEFDSVIATNLRGVFLTTKRVLPVMRKRREGSIVTIASLAGKNGFVGGAAYCASKFGVRGLMQSLFLEVREENVRVITLFPGSVETAFFVTADASRIKSKSALQSEDVAEAVVAAVGLSARADISELDIRPTNPKG